MVDYDGIVYEELGTLVYLEEESVLFGDRHVEEPFEEDWEVLCIYLGVGLLSLPVVAKSWLRNFYWVSLEILVVVVTGGETIRSIILL